MTSVENPEDVIPRILGIDLDQILGGLETYLVEQLLDNGRRS